MPVHKIDWYGRTGPRGNIREAVGVFPDMDSLDRAVEEIEAAGVPEVAISRLAGMKKVERRLGQKAHNIRALEDDPSAPRRAYIASDARAYGHAIMVLAPTYLLAVIGAAIGAAEGGSMMAVIGYTAVFALLGAGLGSYAFFLKAERDKSVEAKERDAGGHILWVHTTSTEEEKQVLSAFTRYGAHDIHMHGPAQSAA